MKDVINLELVKGLPFEAGSTRVSLGTPKKIATGGHFSGCYD